MLSSLCQHGPCGRRVEIQAPAHPGGKVSLNSHLSAASRQLCPVGRNFFFTAYHPLQIRVHRTLSPWLLSLPAQQTVCLDAQSFQASQKLPDPDAVPCTAELSPPKKCLSLQKSPAAQGLKPTTTALSSSLLVFFPKAILRTELTHV